MADPKPAGERRETRLLLATIAVSVGMLLLLARFRFPDESSRTADAPPAPLERLAARATYDELAGVMADLERRIIPAVLALAAQGDDGIRYFPAVRVTADRAVALVPRDRRLVSIEGAPVPPIVLRDPTTDLIVVQQSSPAEPLPSIPAVPVRSGPRYLAIAEATGTTAAARPVYVGRTELINDPRWSEAVLSVAAVQQAVSSGSAVFSLDATFLGLATDAGGRVVIVPGSVLRNAAGGALQPPAARSDLPLDVQPLTAALARAAQADTGVMVSHVLPSVTSDIRSGDVIQSIDGVAVTTVAGFQQIAQSRTPGATVTLQLIRRGQPVVAPVTATRAGAITSGADSGLGAALRAVADVGSEVITVEAGTAASRAGLRRGDLIVAIDSDRQPAPAAVLRAYRDAKAGHALLLTVRRDGDQRVLALEKQ